MTDYAELKARLRDGCNLQQRDGEQAAAAIDALERERERFWQANLALQKSRDAAEARVKRLESDLDRFADANHWQAFCIHATASALGPDYAATIDALPKAARHVRTRAEAAEARVKRLEDALLWCSGSNDFNEGGVARKGWLKICAPLLAALQEDKSHE